MTEAGEPAGWRNAPAAVVAGRGATGRVPVLCVLGAVALLMAGGAPAQSVSLSGSLGAKALLIIDGTPRSVAVGTSVQGVRLLSVGDGRATVEIGGKRVELALGGAQVDLGTADDASGRIVLTEAGGGHFYSAGTINGKAVRFLVDTGATQVAISQAEADRLGLPYLAGRRGMTQTANGLVPVWSVTLDAVRIRDVQVYNVEAIVLPAPINYVLLGNSFLTRFRMKRENDTLTLERRY